MSHEYAAERWRRNYLELLKAAGSDIAEMQKNRVALEKQLAAAKPDTQLFLENQELKKHIDAMYPVVAAAAKILILEKKRDEMSQSNIASPLNPMTSFRRDSKFDDMVGEFMELLSDAVHTFTNGNTNPDKPSEDSNLRATLEEATKRCWKSSHSMCPAMKVLRGEWKLSKPRKIVPGELLKAKDGSDASTAD